MSSRHAVRLFVSALSAGALMLRNMLLDGSCGVVQLAFEEPLVIVTAGILIRRMAGGKRAGDAAASVQFVVDPGGLLTQPLQFSADHGASV